MSHHDINGQTLKVGDKFRYDVGPEAYIEGEITGFAPDDVIEYEGHKVGPFVTIRTDGRNGRELSDWEAPKLRSRLVRKL